MPYLTSRKNDFGNWCPWKTLIRRTFKKTCGALAEANHTRGPCIPHPFNVTALREGDQDISIIFRLGGVGCPVAGAQGLVAHLKGGGLTPKTWGVCIQAISFYSKAWGFSNPCQSFLARKAMEGYRRLSPSAKDGRRPVTLGMLRIEKSLCKVCFSAFKASLFRAAFSLAFFGVFHLSELIAGSRDDTKGRALAVMDVSIQGSALHIYLRRSKTDQLARGGGGATLF